MTRRRRTLCSLALAALAALTVSPRAEAQGVDAASPAVSSENRALAETLFFTARGLMEAKRYGEACLKFAESYRLDPAAGTLINLAVCHENEGKIASAWGEFRQARLEARKANRPDREELADEHIRGLEPDLPFLTIRVPRTAQVPHLEVLRNRSVISQAAWDTELPADPGTVTIVVRAPGFKSSTRSLSIARREHEVFTVEPLEEAPLEVVSKTYWTGRRVGGFVAMLAGGALAVGGGVAGLVAVNARDESDAACPTFDGELRCSQAGVDAMERARTMSTLSTVGLGVGAAALLTGGYFFATAESEVVTRRTTDFASVERKRANAKPKIAWDVIGGPDGARAVLSGAF